MTEIARLRIELEEVRPRVWRRVEVPVTIRLDRLHRVIQAAMGRENSHLWEFRRGAQAWGLPDPHWDDPPARVRPAAKATLADLIGEGARSFTYLYDFGDDWHHKVKVEAIVPAAPKARYPRLTGGERARPPEDVGGPWGYEELVLAMADPAHERHAELLEWLGGPFDPAAFDAGAADRAVAALAERPRRRKPVARQKDDAGG
jgi:hypothetical protein